ncbi:MAG: aldehyde dehydrogenase family protein [Myxococcota bacterium]
MGAVRRPRRPRAARSDAPARSKRELDAVVDAVQKAMKAVAYGDPMDPANIMGPLNSAIQRERVESRPEGLADRVARRRRRPAPTSRRVISSSRPAFIADENSALAQNEVFGPVQCIISYEDERDPIRIANNSATDSGAM